VGWLYGILFWILMLAFITNPKAFIAGAQATITRPGPRINANGELYMPKVSAKSHDHAKRSRKSKSAPLQVEEIATASSTEVEQEIERSVRPAVEIGRGIEDSE
jgi:hypothetical protein